MGTGVLIRLLLAVPFLLMVGGTALIAPYSADTRLIITIITVTMLIRFAAAPITSGLQAFQKMHITAVGDVITNGFISFAGVALVVVFKGGMIRIALVSLAASLVVMSVEGWVLSRTTSIRARFDGKLIRHMIIGSLPYWVSGLVLTFYLWVDSVLLSFFTQPRVVGWYGVATNLFGALLFVPTILSTALLPALAQAHLHDRPGMRVLMRRSFTLITGLSLPLAVGTALLAPAIINRIYGADFAPSGQILAGTFLISADRQIVWTRVMAGACILNPLVNLVTIPYFQRHYGNGGLGAAVALLVTELLMACAGLWLIPRALLDRAALTSLTRSAAATVVMGTVVWLLRGQFVVIPIAIGALVYGAAALALRVFPREDWELVTPILAKITQRVHFQGAQQWIRSLLRPTRQPQSVSTHSRYRMPVLEANLEQTNGHVNGASKRLIARLRQAGDPSNRRLGSLIMPLGRKRDAKERGLSTWALLVEDIRAWKRMGYLGPSDGSELRVKDAIKLIWQSPGLRATITYRVSAGAKRRRIPVLPGILARRNLRRYGLDIVPSVPIGPGLYIPHPVGTVIMARAIGSNCQIISAVTVGMRGLQEFATIGDNVFIGAGARVLGAIHVGDGAQIGANAVLISDVPAGATAVGVPARILPPKRDEWPAERPSESGPALVAQYSQPYVADALVAPTQNHSVRWDADLDATLRRPPDTGAARER